MRYSSKESEILAKMTAQLKQEKQLRDSDATASLNATPTEFAAKTDTMADDQTNIQSKNPQLTKKKSTIPE